MKLFSFSKKHILLTIVLVSLTFIIPNYFNREKLCSLSVSGLTTDCSYVSGVGFPFAVETMKPAENNPFVLGHEVSFLGLFLNIIVSYLLASLIIFLFNSMRSRKT